MDALVPVAVALVLIVAPGTIMLWAVRSRLGFLPGHAPAISCLTLFLLSGVFHLLGIPWTAATVGVGTAAAVALTVGVAFALGRFRKPRPRALPHTGAADAPGTGEPRLGIRRVRDPRGQGLVLLTGALLGGVLLVVPALQGMGSIRILNGSYDAFFHHSAVAFIRESGDAFPFTALAPMYEGVSNYYPTTWHMIASLVPESTVAAANATALASLAILPASVIAMLHTIIPAHRNRMSRALVIAGLGVSSSVFLSIPTTLLFMGLWPFGLGVVMLPAALGALVQFVTRPELGRRTNMTAVLVILGAAVAHPSVLVSLALVVGLTMLVIGVGDVLQRRTRRRGAIVLSVALGLAAVFVWYSLTQIFRMAWLTDSEPWNLLTPLLVTVADRPRIQAIPFDPLPLVPLLLLAVVGSVRAVVTRHRLLLSAGAVAVAAILLTYATYADGDWVQSLSAAWYGARERIHPLFEIAVLVLAAGGALWRPGVLPVLHKVRGERTVVAVVCAALLSGALVGAVTDDRVRNIGSLAYRSYGKALYPYVSQDERRFIEKTSAQLPEDAVVAGIPQDGTPAYWFLGGVTVTQPSLAAPNTLPVRRVATWGDTIAPGSQACRAAREVGVTHLYRDEGIFDADFFGTDTEYLYKGYDNIPERYLTPIAEQRSYVLYRVDLPAC